MCSVSFHISYYDGSIEMAARDVLDFLPNCRRDFTHSSSNFAVRKPFLLGTVCRCQTDYLAFAVAGNERKPPLCPGERGILVARITEGFLRKFTSDFPEVNAAVVGANCERFTMPSHRIDWIKQWTSLTDLLTG